MPSLAAIARRLRSFAWFAFALPFAVYVASLAPGVGYWDTAEMQTVPWILGIAHPTGFPAFILLGWLFVHLEPFGSPAWRMSLFTAIAMAGAATTLALFLREFGMPRWVAVLGAWIFALGYTTWQHGSRAEVHVLATFFASLALLMAVRWLRTKDPRDAVIAAGAYGFGLATHLLTIFVALALLCVALIGRRALAPRTLRAGAIAIVAPLLAYAYIPLRSAYLFAVRRDPTLSIGLPPGQPIWDTSHASGGIAGYLNQAPHQIGDGVAALFTLAKWNAIAQSYDASLLREYGGIGVAVGVVGLLLALRGRPLLWLAMILSVGLPVPFILNFPESDTDRYLLGSFWLFAAAIAIGAYRGAVAYAKGRRLIGVPLAGALLVLLALSLGLSNASFFAQRDDRSAEQLVARIAAETPPNAVIVYEWTYLTTLEYATYVTHTFGDRIPVEAWPNENQASYPTWLKTRAVIVHVNNPPLVFPPNLGIVAKPLDLGSGLWQIEAIGRATASR